MLNLIKLAENEVYWSEPKNLANLVRCQSIVRRFTVRKEFNQIRDLHKSSLFESQIKNVQAQARGVLARRALEDKRIMYEDAEEWITNVRPISMLTWYYCITLNHYGFVYFSSSKLPPAVSSRAANIKTSWITIRQTLIKLSKFRAL